VTVTRNGQDNVARTLDPYSGKFEQVGEDTPRIYGSQQSFLVEAASRTNYVSYSSAINDTNWTAVQVTSSSVPNSLIADEDETAYELSEDGQSAGKGNIRVLSGTFSGSDEVAEVYLEKGTADETAFGVGNTTSSNLLFTAAFDWSAETLSKVAGSFQASHVRKIQTDGPNQKKAVQLIVRYAGGNTENVSGDTRQFRIWPDDNANGGSVIAHHAQLEEAPNASSPIVTGSSATTRGADDVTIFSGGQPEWWNDNEMTLFIELVPRAYADGGISVFILTGGNNNRHIYQQNDIYRWWDGNNSVTNFGSVNPYSVDKIAVSMTRSGATASLNGASTSLPHDGTNLDATRLDLGEKNVVMEAKRVIAFPQSLPATEADRSSGDPISLETLTT
jgi:hypothetical protein